MSLDATRWAFQQTVGSSAERLVLITLADHCPRGSSLSFPSRQRLSKVTLLDAKTITKAMGKLVNRGLIADTGERKGRTGRVAVYCLAVGHKPAANAAKNGAIEKREKAPDLTNPIAPFFPSNDTKNPLLNPTKNGALNRVIESGMNREEAPDGAVAKDFIFREGLHLLTTTGKREDQARACLGKLCRDHSDRDVERVLREAIAAQPVDPIPWLTSRLLTKRRGRAADASLAGNDYTAGLPMGEQAA